MATQTTNRLGDILISKGLITPEQLTIAINEQKKRRQQLAPLDAAQAAPLGEILIELGFINRMQLKRGLGWQSVVRKVTLAMSLCAPLLTISYEAAAAPVAVVSSSSSSKTSSGSAIPLTIQAENYDAMVGVQTETTSDVGGGLNVGYIDANDSMSYVNSSVVIPATGSYKIIYRVAAEGAGGSFTLSEGTTLYDTVTVPNTGGWQKWVDVERTVTLTKGTHSFSIKAVKGGFNFNWFKIDNVGASLPQTIQAEDYASMSGVQTETTSDTGGGMNVGYIDAKDSMSYTSNPISIPTAGTYQLTYRVASEGGGGQFTLNEADTTTVYDTVTVPNTGGWQTWASVTRTVTLPAGTHRFSLVSVSGAFNINWFKIDKVSSSSSSQASSVASSKASSLASSTATGANSSVKSSSSSSAAPVVSSSAPAVSSVSSTPTTAVSSSKAAVSSSSAASSAASAQALPLTIKADSYSTMSGIQTEATSDTGGGNNVGYIDSNDWLNFANTSVNIPKTATYKISYRVASEAEGGVLNLHEAGSSSLAYDTISVPRTGGWQTWTTVERTVTLTAGIHKFGVTATTGGFNLNWIKIEEIAPPLDQTIEAESYTTMSGVQTETTSDTGGGLNVGYIDANDWMSYSGTSVKVPVTGSYKVTYRVASETGGGSFSLVESATGTSYDTVSVGNTGGWQKWTLIERTITLTAGTHSFDIKASAGGFNINWFKISSIDGSTSVSSSSTPTTSVSSSSTPTTTSSSSKASISSSSSATSTTNSNGVVTTQVAGPVGMNWIAPNMRQNGSVLDITEIAGYEIRYKLASADKFTYISINDAWTNTYNFSWLEGNYVFQIAAFDKNGLYSEFVDVVTR